MGCLSGIVENNSRLFGQGKGVLTLLLLHYLRGVILGPPPPPLVTPLPASSCGWRELRSFCTMVDRGWYLGKLVGTITCE